MALVRATVIFEVDLESMWDEDSEAYQEELEGDPEHPEKVALVVIEDSGGATFDNYITIQNIESVELV